MKTKPNSKFYNFTKKQKRRIRTHGKGNMNHAPADFRRCRNRIYRAKCKMVIKRIVSGKFCNGKSERNNEFREFKKDAAWFYW